MVVRRTRKMKEEGSSHPTRELIVQAAAALMKEKGVGALHIDDVLERTELTRGALYHHFKNVDDLIESALLATYAEGIDANISFVRKVLGAANNFQEFRDGVLQANIFYAQNEELLAVRKLRAHAMAVTATASDLSVAIAEEQQRMTDEYVDVIAEAQKKGWVRTNVDPRTLGTFIQAYSFGVIVDDVAQVHVDREVWANLIKDFFDNCIFVES